MPAYYRPYAVGNHFNEGNRSSSWTTRTRTTCMSVPPLTTVQRHCTMPFCRRVCEGCCDGKGRKEQFHLFDTIFAKKMSVRKPSVVMCLYSYVGASGRRLDACVGFVHISVFSADSSQWCVRWMWPLWIHSWRYTHQRAHTELRFPRKQSKRFNNISSFEDLNFLACCKHEHF